MQKRISPLSPVGHRCVADERCSPLRVGDYLLLCHLVSGNARLPPQDIIGTPQKRQTPFSSRIAFRQPAADERCSPLQLSVLLFFAPVGAAIGRPPVKIRSDVKQSESAEKNIAIITGRATAITMTSALKPNCFPAAAGRAGRFLRRCK